MRYLIYLLLGVCVFTSCIEDKSNPGNNAVSTLSFVTPLENVYSREKNSVFTLSVPELKQENSNKELSYEWQVNYEVVSTAKELKFTCKNCGEFSCRLKVSNEDGAIFKDFTLKVPYPYEKGLVVLSRYAGKSMVSFKALNEDKVFVKDVYNLNNESVYLGDEPKDILYNSYYKCFYVATENPTKVVKIEHNTMQALKVVKYPGSKLGRMFAGDVWAVNFITDGQIAELDPKSDGFSNPFQQALNKQYPNAYLADYLVLLHRYGNVVGSVVYDTSRKILLKWLSRQVSDVPNVNAIIEGKIFISMLTLRSEREGIVIVKDGTGEYSVVRFSIPDINTPVDKVISNVSSVSSGMTESSIFMVSKAKDILFYTNGNKIYRYNYASEGNFPSMPDYTVGNDGDIIKAMVLDTDGKKLYVAVNAKEGEYRGGVYCYDNETKKLLWNEGCVAGEIVQMIYKAE